MVYVSWVRIKQQRNKRRCKSLNSCWLWNGGWPQVFYVIRKYHCNGREYFIR